MDYLKIYNLIINNAKKETIEGLRPKTKNRKYIEKYAKNFKHSYYKAKKCYNDGKNNYYFSENETIPSLLKEGMAPQKFSKKRSLSQKGRKCATKGMKHFTDGLKDIMAYECPEGFKLGRPNPEKYVTTLGFKWWNNGLSEKLCKEKPDSNWTLGRIKKCQK